MKITKFRKYITWNLVSLAGYLSLAIVGYFLMMLMISSSQIGIRADLNSYFYDYIVNHVILPYVDFYKVQITFICLMLVGSIFEKKYYDEKCIYGFQIFENHPKVYSIIFVIGLSLNFLPLYLFTIYLLKIFSKLL
ncbi:hypothetical protein HDR58_02335 [bacterium]|nr:hypothetical protein [bacterium]